MGTVAGKGVSEGLWKRLWTAVGCRYEITILSTQWTN